MLTWLAALTLLTFVQQGTSFQFEKLQLSQQNFAQHKPVAPNSNGKGPISINVPSNIADDINNNNNNRAHTSNSNRRRRKKKSKHTYPSGNVFGSSIAAGFYVNWGIYRTDGYDFWAQNLTAEVIQELDIIYYGFAFFCPNATMTHPYWTLDQDPRLKICQNDDTDAFKLTWIDPHDLKQIETLQAMRDQYNQDLKIVLSIGGWTFPSNFFSQMASGEESRTTLINSIANWTSTFNLDGFDFDWEYPGSAPRVDPVEITPSIFKMVVDEGGALYDKRNFVTFLTELRANEVMKDKLITICGQAGLTNVDNGFDVSGILQVADFINIMTYDYFVSATNSTASSGRTGPNQPLNAPGDGTNGLIEQWNITGTLEGYISRGAAPEQLLVGIALYGHNWYIPDCTIDDVDCWDHFGLEATLPGPNRTTCSNVTAYTYAPSAGKYTKQCGFYSIYEIENAGFMLNAKLDNNTQCMISYIDTPGADDGWTPKNTFMTWLGTEGIKAVINVSKQLGIGGAFVFDFSTDAHANGEWTFEYFKTMAQCVKGSC